MVTKFNYIPADGNFIDFLSFDPSSDMIPMTIIDQNYFFNQDYNLTILSYPESLIAKSNVAMIIDPISQKEALVVMLKQNFLPFSNSYWSVYPDDNSIQYGLKEGFYSDSDLNITISFDN